MVNFKNNNRRGRFRNNDRNFRRNNDGVKYKTDFVSSSKFGASLIFKGTVRNKNDNNTSLIIRKVLVNKKVG